MISPTDGIILGMATMPAVKPGEAVYHIARLKKSEFAALRRDVDNISSHQIFNRMQEDLSTNIMIQEHSHPIGSL